MKTSGENGGQVELCLKHEAFGATDSNGIFMIRKPEQTRHHSEKQSNVIGLSKDVQLNLLRAENQKLKALVDDLIHDKTCQAQRITELDKEKSRLKKVLADLILDTQN